MNNIWRRYHEFINCESNVDHLKFPTIVSMEILSVLGGGVYIPTLLAPWLPVSRVWRAPARLFRQLYPWSRIPVFFEMEFPGKYREKYRGLMRSPVDFQIRVMQFLYRTGRGRLEIARWLRGRSNPCSRCSRLGQPRSMQFLWDRCSTKSDWKLDNVLYVSVC